jgi:hypothetical protein
MVQGRHYIVTNWHSDQPNKRMSVWTDIVTDTKVVGHVTEEDYPFTTCSTWLRSQCDEWTWTEYER